jgi:2-keto-4-pentenoate hydratase/2-oxohepta-3-ene-1,7-dioic acid hydratase in catechol pathway
MKLVTFILEETQRVGVITTDGTGIVDLQAAAQHFADEQPDIPASTMAMLEAGEEAFDLARDLAKESEAEDGSKSIIPIGDATPLSPVPRPRSIRDCLAFERHLIQATRTIASWKAPTLVFLDRSMKRLFGKGFLRPPPVWYERPIYYKGNSNSVVGHESDIQWPSFSKRLDFELEFGVFIGKEGCNIPASKAAEHIAGYCLFNDFSARDTQAAEMTGRLGPAKSKDFDTGNALGPWLVTPDEVPDEIILRARVNGEEWSCSSSSEMHFSFAEIIEYISRDETLYPGDFIGSGTVPGGCGLELDRWIQPGDIVELEAEPLGTLRNRVVR